MNPYFLMYKGIGITWFIFLGIISALSSYGILKLTLKKYSLSKDKLEDYLFLLIIVGLIGSRIFYVLFNLDVYRGSFSYIFKLSHMNLNLLGGVIFGLITIYVLSRKEKVSFYTVYDPYIVPFYLSMAISIWSMHFDGMLIGKKYDGIFKINYLGATRHPVGAYLSLLFVLGIILEVYLSKKGYKRIYSIMLLAFILILYYLIKMIFLY